VDKQSFYTVQTHIHNIREVSEGAPLRLTLQVLDIDDKRMHIFHAMYHGAEGHLLATGEQMLVHVDMAQGRAAPMPKALYQRVAAVHRAHTGLPRPAQAGQPLGIRRKAPA